jgi:hypothetical protein
MVKPKKEIKKSATNSTKAESNVQTKKKATKVAKKQQDPRNILESASALETDLPELPTLDNELSFDFDFENIPTATAEPEIELKRELPEEISKTQAEDTNMASKLPWYKKIFRKKEEKSAEQLNQEILSAFKDDSEDYLGAQEEALERREQIYIENMKRRMDQEVRERHKHLDSQHKEVQEREKDVAAKEQELVKREFETVKKEKEVQEILDLKEQIENLSVSLAYQKQRIEELKSELALKDAELKDREIQLDEREEKLKELEKVQLHEQQLIQENIHLKEEVDEEDDAIEYLERELEKQRREFEEKVLALSSESLKTPDAIETIHQLITECYVELSQGNSRNIRETYNKIREIYTTKGKRYDANKSVYKEILRLYEDIRKQSAK